MSTRRNLNVPGHAHELTFTCYRRYPFLTADRTCRWLSEAVDQACGELDYDLWAYVFMPEHVHLIVNPRLPRYDIAAFRRQVKEPVGRRAIRHIEQHHAEWLPRVTRQRGKRTERLFWQPGGGYDRNITDPRTLYHMIDYLHDNPLRRALVTRPDLWLYSSANWYINQVSGPCVIHAIPERYTQ